MKVKVLDKIERIQKKGCFLCSISLWDYLNCLDFDYDKFDVQRKIVDNKYLDLLAQTVFSGGHIPIITLVLTDDPLVDGAEIEINEKNFRILDGLQRTWRLNAIMKLSEWLLKNYKTNENIRESFVKGSLRNLQKEKRKEIIDCGVRDYTQAKNIAKQIIDTVGIENVKDELQKTNQWFEVWYGLEKDEIVDKMLLLNAGHKAVSMRHQIELLYFDWFDVFSELQGIDIIRDKDAGSPVRFVAERKLKTYRFSDLVMATIAFIDGKYKKIQSTFVQEAYMSDKDDDRFNKSAQFYKSIISFIGDVDVLFVEKYGEAGRTWFGRENNIEAFMGAVGKKCWENYYDLDIDSSLKNIKIMLETNIEYINLNDFEMGKSKLSSSKINIGQTTKEVVYTVFNRIFSAKIDCNIDWEVEFKRIGGV